MKKKKINIVSNLEKKSIKSSSGKYDKNMTKGPGETSKSSHPDRTRYGDWEKNGRCIDF